MNQKKIIEIWIERKGRVYGFIYEEVEQQKWYTHRKSNNWSLEDESGTEETTS